MPKLNLKLPEWLQAKNDLEDGDGDVDLTIAEPIGFDPETYDGISSKTFGSILAALKDRKVNLHINTLGGDVDEGTAMYHMAVAHGNVHTNVIGYAASIGAIVAQGGKTRTMQPGTMMLIHNPRIKTSGEAKDLQRQLDVLKVVKGNIVDLLASRTGQKKADISDMMDATTAMGPKEAKRLGFCDSIGTSTNVTNSIEPEKVFTLYRQLSVAHSSTAAGGGPEPAATEPKVKNMSKLTDTLARLKIIPAADMTDDAAAAAVEQSVTGLNTTVTGLQADNLKHANALQARVTNRVKKAIEDKKVKADREASLIAIGVKNEADLDFLDDIVVATNAAPAVRRGATPAPAATTETGYKNAAEQLDELREKMKTEKDPAEIGRLAIKCRELRGAGDIFKSDAPTKHVLIDGKAYPIAS